MSARPTPSPAEKAGALTRFAAYENALAEAGLHSRPIGLLDLEAFDANADDLSRRAGSKPIRVVSKSLRIRGAIERALQQPGYSGVLSFTLPEAIWLAQSGVQDIVMGYPCVDAIALQALADSEIAVEQVTLMIDSTTQLDALAAAAPNHPRIQVAVELDAAYRPVSGVGIGAARSPLRTAKQLAALGAAITERPNVLLTGMMTYEGQIAGVPNAASGPRGAVVRAMQRASAKDIKERRAQMCSTF